MLAQLCDMRQEQFAERATGRRRVRGATKCQRAAIVIVPSRDAAVAELFDTGQLGYLDVRPPCSGGDAAGTRRRG